MSDTIEKKTGRLIELSTLLKMSVSTYYGPMGYDDCIYEMGKEDLENQTDYGQWYYEKNGEKIYVNQEDLKYVDYDYDYDFEGIKTGIAEVIGEEIAKYVDMNELFGKYDIEYLGNNFYTPHYYNYDDDSYDIELYYNGDLEGMDFLEKYGLVELVQQYIDEVRQPSYDGYCSFEPRDLDDVNRDDYCTIRAILQKEGVFGDLKKAIEDVIMDGYVCDIRLENLKNQEYTITEYIHENGKVDYKWDTDVEKKERFVLSFEELA